MKNTEPQPSKKPQLTLEIDQEEDAPANGATQVGSTPKDLDIFDFGELKTFFEAQVGARFDDVEPTGQLAEFWRVASGDRRPRRY